MLNFNIGFTCYWTCLKVWEKHYPVDTSIHFLYNWPCGTSFSKQFVAESSLDQVIVLLFLSQLFKAGLAPTLG